MGGPMGVYEDFPSKNDELSLIKGAIGTVPMLGMCLGSQLIAHSLDARVYPNEKDEKPVKEIGYYTVQLTPEGKAKGLRSPLPFRVHTGDGPRACRGQSRMDARELRSR